MRWWRQIPDQNGYYWIFAASARYIARLRKYGKKASLWFAGDADPIDASLLAIKAWYGPLQSDRENWTGSPDGPGFYWARRNDGILEMVEVLQRSSGLLVCRQHDDNVYPLPDIQDIIAWQGPLESPIISQMRTGRRKKTRKSSG